MQTYTILQKDPKPANSKWIFKIKCKSNDNIDKYKTRLAAKGYTQVLGVDFMNMFPLILN